MDKINLIITLSEGEFTFLRNESKRLHIKIEELISIFIWEQMAKKDRPNQDTISL